jgi:hypothetical protein
LDYRCPCPVRILNSASGVWWRDSDQDPRNHKALLKGCRVSLWPHVRGMREDARADEPRGIGPQVPITASPRESDYSE